MPQPAIVVQRLTKRFGDVVAVDDLSFDVAEAENVGLLGPNGAGKTTTIQMILGLTTPTSGDIRVLGMDVRNHRRQVLQRVNFSSAYISLPSNLTARENLTFFARLYGIRRAQRRIDELLGMFEIAEVRDRVTGALSSGQMTRLNLCKAFLNDPDVLFLDEPTASLDPDIAEKVRGILTRLRQERRLTMVYTSHNMHEIEAMCDRVLFLSRGRIVAQGTPKDVLSQARTQSLEQVFISIARDGELRDLSVPRE
ncbi:ABC transporter ATP-binding protein [Candidatus Poribacteria bacterium]|nr:ABC transporter ATP-binding protein [Candidatus Poribacteria bacterium]